MLNITTEVVSSEVDVEKATLKKVSLKQYVLEKLRTWVNGLLEGERDEFLGRGTAPTVGCRARQLSQWVSTAEDQLVRAGRN